MKIVKMLACTIGIVALSLAGMVFVSGCEGGGGGSGGSGVVGTWSGGGDGRTVFKSDGTWAEYDDAALTQRHLGGSYSQSGSHVSGTGNNPGVGDLDIDGTISDDGKTLQLDFIEHWHDPYKHNPATLTRQ
jgi:hypothetical protein